MSHFLVLLLLPRPPLLLLLSTPSPRPSPFMGSPESEFEESMDTLKPSLGLPPIPTSFVTSAFRVFKVTRSILLLLLPPPSKPSILITKRMTTMMMMTTTTTSLPRHRLSFRARGRGHLLGPISRTTRARGFVGFTFSINLEELCFKFF
jgi:hypothetical protein